MQSLSEEGSGDNAVSKNRTTQLAIVKEKLAVQQSLKRKLKEQIKYMEEQKVNVVNYLKKKVKKCIFF